MSKPCFKCQKYIDDLNRGECQSCGARFNTCYEDPDPVRQKMIDSAINFKRSGEFEKSIKIYEQLNIEHPNNPIILRSFAKALASNGNYDLALEYFVQVRALNIFFDITDPDCDEFINILLTEPRDSEFFYSFLKRIKGNQTYKIDNEKIIDSIDIIGNFENKKRPSLNSLNENKGMMIANMLLRDHAKEHGPDSITIDTYARLGVLMMNRGEMDASRSLFLKGASFGLNQNTPYYDSSEAQNIGRCLTMLLTQCDLDTDRIDEDTNNTVIKATALAYTFLSHSLETDPSKAQYALMLRACLIKDHKYQSAVQILMNELGSGQLFEPYIIADCFKAANSEDSAFQELLSTAKELHSELDCISVSGKNADEYSLEEMAKVGEERHALLFSILKQKFKKGEYSITEHQLQEAIHERKNEKGIDLSRTPF